jgi:3-isopropylmalate/(R)-2-methylmalate dehydratase large subunit
MHSLRMREVKKRPDKVRFAGRILFLTEDPELIKRQLSGEDLGWDPGMKLRDNLSTDEITPAYICYYFDDTLGEFPYLGLKAGEEFPITRGSVKNGGFVCSVSGKRRGKGSSREQSPFAEMVAGIEVVVAENIERIYNQNCQNLGLLTTTNFDLIEKIRSGAEIPLTEFTLDADPITRQIIEYGGLFYFNVARFQNKAIIPALETGPRPMTLAEKICARHFVRDLARDAVGVRAVKPGDSGFVRCDIRFSHEYVTPMAAIFFEKFLGAEERVNDPSSIYFFRDHLTYLSQTITPERRAAGLLAVAEQLKVKQEAFAARQGIKLHGELTGSRTGSEAICHSKILQSYALPGQLLIGSDSHTTHSGAVGCLAFGVGTTDIFNSWITKDVRIRVPESVKIVIRGRKPASVAAKDFMLEILRRPFVRDGEAIGKIVEYSGDAVEALNVDERATMTNMAAEIGAFTGIVAPDGKTVDYLVANRGISKTQAEALCEGMDGDPGAEYSRVVEIDASAMRPMVALPGDPGNGVYLDELEKEIRIDIAYGGSCTGGKAEDMDMYATVFRNALAHGRRVHPSVRCYIQFGSQEVRDHCQRQGYIETFRDVGARIIEPSCGACINAGPGVSRTKDEVTISAINRNFPGRSGPGQMYLASPLTVAASAIEGKIAPYTP